MPPDKLHAPRAPIVEFRKPSLIFLGAETNRAMAKTAIGIADWQKQHCVGQLSLPGASVDLGLPEMTVRDAYLAGARSLILGIASVGGRLEPDWIRHIENALECGMDIVSGLHTKLTADSDIRGFAARSSGKLVDVRTPPSDIPVGNGLRRAGLRALTVGTDCAVGKKYTALSLWKRHTERGGSCEFCASGQTGIIIAGRGIPIDAVVSDFISGAAEILSPAAPPSHWQFIEGQGSLFHPAYAGVSLGLLHGSQPDAIIVCHEYGRTRLNVFQTYPVPSLETCIAHHLECARLTNPDVRCAGISVNTSILSDAESADYLGSTSQRLGLPCIDPMRTSVDPILDVLAQFPPNAGLH
ncbi:MAG: DUF1611 domain-containing protein [Pseudomonadota bacterium]